MSRRNQFIAASLVMLAALVTAVPGGPLNPPAGPVTSTPGPEARIAINDTNTPGDADSRYRITQSGSYYLTGNITGSALKSCIKVSADDVTIDLNGYTIYGVSQSTAGVSIPSINHNLTVKNGFIRSVGNGPAVNFSFTAARGATIERVTVMSCAGGGLLLGLQSTVRDCRVQSVGTQGIRAGSESQVTDTTIESVTGGVGIGIAVGNASIVRACVVSSASGVGILGSDGVSIINSVVEGCTGNGIETNNGGKVSDNVVRNNGGVGILTASACIIESNDATFSGSHGISFSGHCTVRDNVAVSNGQSGAGAGVFTNSFRSRIERNQSVQNVTGFRATASLNFFSANTAGSNTSLNWDIVASNRCLVVAGASVPAISGNFGGASPGSTDPNANYTN